jgi:hypothetical protein
MSITKDFFTITVTCLNGESRTFEKVGCGLTVKKFKKAVCAGFNGYIVPSRQRLILKGKQLEDDRTLDSYDLQEPILFHLVLRMYGGCGPFPEVDTSFPHEKDLRDICVNGKHWGDIPAPEPRVTRFQNWNPMSIHEKPVRIELYQQLLCEIRDTPLSVEEVGHRILTQNGYVKRQDGFYEMSEGLRKITEEEEAQHAANEEFTRAVRAWMMTRPKRCEAFDMLEVELDCRAVKVVGWGV